MKHFSELEQISQLMEWEDLISWMLFAGLRRRINSVFGVELKGILITIYYTIRELNEMMS